MRQDALHEVDLDTPVSAGEELTLLLEITRSHNGSCAAEIIRPRLEGPGGTLDLSAIRRFAEANGWGRLSRSLDNDGKPITDRGEAVAESLWCHAPARLAWVVPPGYDRFRARVVCRHHAEGYRARVEVRSPPADLTPGLRALHQVVAFDIPKIGAYAAGFPNHGDAKSALVARMTADWLAGQQQPNGSWPRTCGYTGDAYDTAWAGLGLLAQQDPAHEAHIRRAAEYIAFDAPEDGWAVPGALKVMFLSEYWLRTRDDRILTALQSQVERLQGEMVYGDWNGGHGHNPGYGGSGRLHRRIAPHPRLRAGRAHPGPGRAGLVRRMLARAQELAPDGFIPYGRGPAPAPSSPIWRAAAPTRPPRALPHRLDHRRRPAALHRQLRRHVRPRCRRRHGPGPRHPDPLALLGTARRRRRVARGPRAPSGRPALEIHPAALP
ncbi:MAG: DUF6288 domain-containing protein [Kiritimatiellia bacterium]